MRTCLNNSLDIHNEYETIKRRSVEEQEIHLQFPIPDECDKMKAQIVISLGMDSTREIC